ncbi:hypothetical protein OG609_07135 [Streptomyces sp. NBC_01224]|uniref:hypothetical protein n=1 Tax=unclassified Streptomyces TaxID=2593676 RepID=UPI002E0F2C74|nr:hypothetical protein OG609_07135 [Streptomyces sp. NBC_01224]
MIVILGLIILIAAVVVAVAGVLTNAGSAHQLTDGFSVFGYHVTGSTGTLFLYGIVVGALALLGLSLLIAAARRPSHHSRTSRRAPGQPGREPAADHNDAIGRHQTDRAETAPARGSDRPHDDRPVAPDGGHRSRWHLFGHRPAPR